MAAQPSCVVGAKILCQLEKNTLKKESSVRIETVTAACQSSVVIRPFSWFAAFSALVFEAQVVVAPVVLVV